MHLNAPTPEFVAQQQLRSRVTEAIFKINLVRAKYDSLNRKISQSINLDPETLRKFDSAKDELASAQLELQQLEPASIGVTFE